MNRTISIALTSLALAAAACGGDDDPSTATRTLGLSFTGLTPLGADYVYEGWILVNGAPVTTGRFTISSKLLSPTTAATLEVTITRFTLADLSTLLMMCLTARTSRC